MSRLILVSRAFIALITALTWFGGTNLCGAHLLGCAAAKSSCSCCHTDGTPGKPAPTACEKLAGSQLAVIGSDLSLTAPSKPAPRPLPYFLSLLEFCPVRPAPEFAAPPGRIRFAELVLQESLFAQAPPRA